MERTLYILILIVAAIFESTKKVNTNNAFVKISIGCIMLGALGHILNVPNYLNPFVEIGLIGYLITMICSSYMRNRRVDDETQTY